MRPGRPRVMDKRVRVHFMAQDSIYQKALEIKGQEGLQQVFEIMLIGIANSKK